MPDVTQTGVGQHHPVGHKSVAGDLADIRKTAVPTLVLTGGKDAIYPVPADKQASLLTGSNAVTAATIPDTGHALTFHRSQDQFQAQLRCG